MDATVGLDCFADGKGVGLPGLVKSRVVFIDEDASR